MEASQRMLLVKYCVPGETGADIFSCLTACKVCSLPTLVADFFTARRYASTVYAVCPCVSQAGIVPK